MNKDILIFWRITAYTDPEQIIYTINYILENSNDFIYLHYDKNSSVDEFEQIKQNFDKNDRVCCFQIYHTSWGVCDVIHALYFMLKEFHSKNIPYDYTINLTGKMFFSKSLKQLKQRLKTENGKSFLWLPSEKSLFLEDTSEENRDRAYKKHTKVSLVYQKFYTKGSDVYKNINPDLTFGELSRMLVHFNYFPASFRGSRIRMFLNRVRIVLFISYNFITGIHLFPFGVLSKSYKYTNTYNIVRGSCHYISHYDTNKKIITDDLNVTAFIKQFRFLTCPDEIVEPSLVYHYTDRDKLVLNDNFGLWFYAPLDVNTNFYTLIEDPELFFVRKCEGVEVNKKLAELLKD